MKNLVRSIFVREVNAREALPNIWTMYYHLREHINSACTYEQLTHCAELVDELILEKYSHMKWISRFYARKLDKSIQRKEIAIHFDNLNTMEL